MQLKADITGRSIEVYRGLNPGTAGAAVLAGKGCGIFSTLKEGNEAFLKHLDKIVYEPDDTKHIQYSHEFENYLKIRQRFKEVLSRTNGGKGLKNVMIFGEGKIGRGFAAKIFKEAGYKPIFIDHNVDLVNLLNKIKKYSIHKIPSIDRKKRIMINDYQAFSDRDRESLTRIFPKISLIAVCVFSNAFAAAGEFIARCINKRAEQQPQGTLDIIVMANTLHAGKLLNEEIQKKLSDKCTTGIGMGMYLFTDILIKEASELISDRDLYGSA